MGLIIRMTIVPPVRAVWIIVGFAVLGCHTVPAPVVLPEDTTPATGLMPPPQAPATPSAAEMSWLGTSDPSPGVSAPASARAIRKATEGALVRPVPKDFRRAVARYRYCDGCVWEILTKPHKPTHLVFDLPNGWLLWNGLDVGEDGWWVVEERKTGDLPMQQGHLLVTPKAAGKTGDMTVLTEQGVYYLHFRSVEGLGLTAVSWQHPPRPSPHGPRAVAGLYYTGYTRSSIGPAPGWTPRIWDTGDDGRTLLLFPQARQTHEAPLVYLVSRAGEKHLVNYEVRGPWYIIHRRFERAELRIGHDDKAGAEVVLLERGAQYRAIRCPGDEACPPDGWQ
jgi:type IV secretion system protein TrbG